MIRTTLLHRHRRVVLSACIVLWTAAFVTTHIPAGRLPSIHTSDIVMHTVGFFVLATVFWATLSVYRARPWRRAVVVVCTLAAYAAVDEITQPFFNRCAAWGDWIADVAGALAATCLLEAVSFLAKRRSPAIDEPRP